MGAKERSDFYVYVLFRENGQPFYIGKGQRDRLSAHLSPSNFQGRIRNQYKNRIIEKMVRSGLDIPRIKIAQRLTEAQAFATETAFIKAIGRHPNGPLVNMSDGGEGHAGRTLSETHKAAFIKKGRKITEETRARMSAAQKGKQTRLGLKNSLDHNERISAALKGNTCAKGRVLTPETRAKLSAAGKGRKPSAACIEAVKRANTGKVHTDETRAKLSEAKRGNQYTKGRKISEAHKAALMAGHAKLKGRPGRKLTPEEIEKRTATLRANRTPEAIAKRAAIMKGRPQSPEHIAARMAGKVAAKARREAENGIRA